MNGYVTLGMKYNSFFPEPFPLPGRRTLPIIAPYWMDFDSSGKPDLNHDASTIWYHEYRHHYQSEPDENTAYILKLAEEDVELRAGDVGFKPTLVIVITWENMVPYWFDYMQYSSQVQC